MDADDRGSGWLGDLGTGSGVGWLGAWDGMNSSLRLGPGLTGERGEIGIWNHKDGVGSGVGACIGSGVGTCICSGVGTGICSGVGTGVSACIRSVIYDGGGNRVGGDGAGGKQGPKAGGLDPRPAHGGGGSLDAE